MDAETLTTIFLVGGIALMIMETLIPGGVSFFLGLSGLLVGALRWLGIVQGPMTSLLTWLFTSVVLILVFRPLLMKFWGGDTSYKLADEDVEAMDEVVKVIEDVNSHDNSGRIRFRGISWQAKTLEGNIKAGSRAQIRYRENVTWIVEPMDELEG